jgi:hypothetical protein
MAMSDGLKVHYSNPKFDGKPWAADSSRKRKSARNLTPATIKPYLGDKPAAVRAHNRRVRDAWLAIADKHLAAGKSVSVEAPAAQSPSLEKLNRRSHELHVRRIEKIKQKYGN